MSEGTMETLAQAIRHTVKTAEESYSDGRYRITIHEAAKQAAILYGDPRMEIPISLMLYHTWNDALDWAATYPE